MAESSAITTSGYLAVIDGDPWTLYLPLLNVPQLTVYYGKLGHINPSGRK